jgi:anti-sigma-K factor RskA
MSGFDHDREGAAPWEPAPGTAPNDWELAAAAVDLAVLSRGGEPLPALPAELAARLRRDAPMHLPRAIAIDPRPEARAGGGRPGGRSWLAAAGWWAAACLAGVLFWQWIGLQRAPVSPVAPAAAPSLAELRARLLAEDPAAVTVAWKKASDDPAVVADQAALETAGGLGDVVWSPARRQGYMRFRGLAANDPSQAQYQLWIFDAERNEAHPVDGGVFDVPADPEGDVVVRIDPRLPVSRATAFAITVERPGGVVVSSRERLPLLAALP